MWMASNLVPGTSFDRRPLPYGRGLLHSGEARARGARRRFRAAALTDGGCSAATRKEFRKGFRKGWGGVCIGLSACGYGVVRILLWGRWKINQHYFSVKTILFTLALPAALCAATGAAAQNRVTMPVPKADSVFVSENTEGDYLVRKYEVRNDADTGYELFYPISNSTLNASFDDNARSMESIGAFLASFEGDSPLTMRRITITGYASPDGPVALNRRLAE